MRQYLTFSLRENNKSLCSGTRNYRRFINLTKKIDWTKNPTVNIRVCYGQDIDNFGQLLDFANEGKYSKESDFWIALGAFVEDFHKVPRQTQHFLDLLCPTNTQPRAMSVPVFPLESPLELIPYYQPSNL